jgi:hypothetical protein
MVTAPQQRTPLQPRSGRQLVAFAFIWLSVLLMILAGWLAMAQAGRLLRWSKADAEVQRAEVYRTAAGSGGHYKQSWGAAVTIHYVANGKSVTATVDRGFQTGIRPWMEHWTRQFPAGAHKKILFNPVDPGEADLNSEWSLSSFSPSVEFALAAALLFWGWRRLRRAAPSR